MNIRTQLITGLIMLLALPAAAQGTRVSAMPAETYEGAAEAGGTLTLGLDEAYQMALTRNLDLQIARYGIASASESIMERSGIFDPSLGASISGDFSESPSATQLAGAEIQENRSTTFGLNLTQLMPTGTSITLQTGFTRSETNSTFFFLNPRWSSNLSASLSQPLLDGFGTLVNRSGIVIAHNARDQSLTGFETSVVNTLRDVENAYWDYISAQESVKVKQRSLELATRLLNETRERVKVGTSAPIDLVQSEAGVATRTQELISSQNAAANAEDGLKAILGFDQADEWTATIEATESYDAQFIHPSLDQAINTGLGKRPEVRQKHLEIEQQDIQVKLARNTLLPDLNLTAEYSYSGIGGKGEDEIDGQTIVLEGGFSDSWKQLRDREFPGWTLRLDLTVPIGNNEAKAQLAQRRYDLEQKRVELNALQQSIIQQVRNAVRALEDGAASVDAAVASREFAERNLEAEETKFANGLSTNYQVLEIQEDLAQAQLSELQARIDYRKAIAGYRVATGTMLDSHDIRIENPAAPEAPHDFWGDVEWLQFVDLKDAASRLRGSGNESKEIDDQSENDGGSGAS